MLTKRKSNLMQNRPKDLLICLSLLLKKIGAKQEKLKPKSKLVVKLSEDRKRVLVEPLPEDPIESACGILSGGASLVQTLVEEREKERRIDSKEIA